MHDKCEHYPDCSVCGPGVIQALLDEAVELLDLARPIIGEGASAYERGPEGWDAHKLLSAIDAFLTKYEGRG